MTRGDEKKHTIFYNKYYYIWKRNPVTDVCVPSTYMRTYTIIFMYRSRARGSSAMAHEREEKIYMISI